MSKPVNERFTKGMARFLALYLSLALGLPSPAFALRQTDLEEQTDDQGNPVGPKAELVAALRVSSVPVQAMAGGLEELPETLEELFDPGNLPVSVRPGMARLIKNMLKKRGIVTTVQLLEQLERLPVRYKGFQYQRVKIIEDVIRHVREQASRRREGPKHETGIPSGPLRVSETPVEPDEVALSEDIGVLGLPTRAENALREHGIQTLRDLTNKSAQELIRIRYIGQQALSEIYTGLTKRGLSLKQGKVHREGGELTAGLEEFVNSRGERIVTAITTPTDTDPHPVAFVFHGLSGNKEQEHIRKLGDALTQTGYIVIRPDFRNNRIAGKDRSQSDVNQSDGELPAFSLAGQLDDVATIIEQLPSKIPNADLSRVVLAGHSYGGWTARRVAALAAQGDPRFAKLGVKTVVDLSGVINPRGSVLFNLMNRQKKVALEQAKEMLEQWKQKDANPEFNNQRYWLKDGEIDWGAYNALVDLNRIPPSVFYMYVVGDRDDGILNRGVEAEYGSAQYGNLAVSQPVSDFLKAVEQRGMPPLIWPNLQHEYAGPTVPSNAPADVLDKTIEHVVRHIPKAGMEEWAGPITPDALAEVLDLILAEIIPSENFRRYVGDKTGIGSPEQAMTAELLGGFVKEFLEKHEPQEVLLDIQDVQIARLIADHLPSLVTVESDASEPMGEDLKNRLNLARVVSLYASRMWEAGELALDQSAADMAHAVTLDMAIRYALHAGRASDPTSREFLIAQLDRAFAKQTDLRVALTHQVFKVLLGPAGIEVFTFSLGSEGYRKLEWLRQTMIQQTGVDPLRPNDPRVARLFPLDYKSWINLDSLRIYLSKVVGTTPAQDTVEPRVELKAGTWDEDAAVSLISYLNPPEGASLWERIRMMPAMRKTTVRVIDLADVPGINQSVENQLDLYAIRNLDGSLELHILVEGGDKIAPKIPALLALIAHLSKESTIPAGSGLEGASTAPLLLPYDPTLRDRTAQHNRVGPAGRWDKVGGSADFRGPVGSETLSEDLARFVMNFIRDRLLENGRVNRDRTLKSYLQFLIGARQGRVAEEADRIGLDRIRSHIRHDSYKALGAYGTANGRQERISLATELLEDARRAISEGQPDADVVEFFADTLVHEVNHVLDERYHRLDNLIGQIRSASRLSPEEKMRWEYHLIEMSAIGRTAAVFRGIYVPDATQPIGGAFIYSYENAARSRVAYGTETFPYQPAPEDYDGVPQDARGTPHPWTIYRKQLERMLDAKASAGMEERGTPAVGLKALLEYVAQEDVIRTIAFLAETLAENERTRDVSRRDFPALEGLAKKAGFAGGVAAIIRTIASGEAVFGVPAEYAAQGIPIFAKKEWTGRIRQNLSKLEAAGQIRFVESVADAYLVIGDKSASVRPDQVLIATNEETVSRVTPHLLQELQINGLLKAGSVVMLYKLLKDSVLVFA